MSFVEHLEELRRRLIVMIAAVVILGIVGWFLAPHILSLLERPLCLAEKHAHYNHSFSCRLFTTSIYGAFTLKLKVAVVTGIILSFPIILSQAWAFVVPALPTRFYRYGPFVIAAGIVLFAAGGVTAYEVMPLAINFFIGQGGNLVTIIADGSNYISFVTLIVLVFGISFEMPLVLDLLCIAGITNSRWLWKKRVVVFFIIFAVATLITPGADWISPLVLGAVLYVLYLISLLVARALGH